MTAADWHTNDFPELRERPPWVMQEMMAAQPALARDMLEAAPAGADALAAAVRATVDAGAAVTVCGCGTSEHGAHAVAALLAAALPDARRALVQARPAFAAALEPRAGLCLAVSHDGETRATVLALEAARNAGGRTAAITASAEGNVARAADDVLLTPERDRSWCHTVAYTSAILAAARITTLLGLAGADAAAAERTLRQTLDGLDGVAAALAPRRILLCAGGGLDHVTARELSLKIAEGARLPTSALELETVVHGQLAGHDAGDALILVAVADHPDREQIARRATHVAEAAAAIGLPVAAVLSERFAPLVAPGFTPAGRLVVTVDEALEPTLAALLTGAAGLQALTLALAHARGTNPDLIRREEAPYRAAAAAAESPGDW